MTLNSWHTEHIRAVAVTFSVSAPGLDPDAVSATLGMSADDAGHEGEVRRNRAGASILPQATGWWAVSTSGKLESKDLREHLRFLLARLLPHAESIRALAREGEVYFDVLWQSTYLYAGTGPLLDPSDLQGIAELRAGMGFDIYQIDEESESASLSREP